MDGGGLRASPTMSYNGYLIILEQEKNAKLGEKVVIYTIKTESLLEL